MSASAKGASRQVADKCCQLQNDLSTASGEALKSWMAVNLEAPHKTSPLRPIVKFDSIPQLELLKPAAERSLKQHPARLQLLS